MKVSMFNSAIALIFVFAAQNSHSEDLRDNWVYLGGLTFLSSNYTLASQLKNVPTGSGTIQGQIYEGSTLLARRYLEASAQYNYSNAGLVLRVVRTDGACTLNFSSGRLMGFFEKDGSYLFQFAAEAQNPCAANRSAPAIILLSALPNGEIQNLSVQVKNKRKFFGKYFSSSRDF